MSKVYKNIDDLFQQEYSAGEAQIPDSVKQHLDNNLVFGGDAVDDLFRSEMNDKDVDVPSDVKANIDSSLGFGEHAIDDLFKSELGDSAVVVPESVKKGVYTSLTFRSDLVWKVGAPVLLLLLLMGGYLYTGSPHQSSRVNGEYSSIHSFNSNSVSTPIIADNDDSNFINESEKISGHSNEKNPVERAYSAAPSSSNTGSTDDHSTGMIANTPAIDANSNATTGLVDSENTQEPDTRISDGETSVNDQNNDLGSNEEKHSSDSSIFSSAENQDTKTDSGLDDTTGNNPEEVAEDIEAEVDDELAELDSADVSEEKSTTDITNETETAEVKIEKPDVPANKPWMLSATAGLNLTRNFYTSSNFGEEQLYQISMEDKLGQEFQLNTNYRFKKGLVLGTGAHFSQVNEHYHFVDQYWLNDSTATEDYTWGTEYSYGWEYVYDSTMVPIDSSWVVMDSMDVIVDTLVSYTYDSTFIDNYNVSGMMKATYFSIPLNFGTQITWKKFRFDILAIIRYNILIGARGTYYDDASFIGFTKKSNNILRKSYFDFQFAGAVHYNIYKNLFLTANIRYRPVFGTMYENTSFNKKMHYTHLGLGLSLTL